jgi:glycosyl transferase family 87
MARRLRTTPRELKGQLIALGVALWVVAIVNAATPTAYLRSGQVRGTDFVQFYTLGRLAATGQVTRFDDFDAIRRTQLAAVPEATNVWFPPVYGPQVPLALEPLGFLSYNGALAVWVAFSVVVFLGLCRVVIDRSDEVSKHRGLALIAAATFPAFWQLVQHGQLTVVAVAAIVSAWLLLRGGREVAAGAVLGLLVYKPPLLAPVLVVLLLARAWKVLAPALLAGAAEVLVTVFWVGFDGIRRYVLLMLHLPSMSTLLFTKPEQAHGLKAFWMMLVPQPTVALVLYVLTALVVLVLAAAIWRTQPDPSRRMSSLVLAIALAAPYLFVYDLTILAPVWIWLVDWFLTHDVPARVGRVLYAGYLAPLVAPIVPFIHVQPSVLCLAFLLVALWRHREAPRLQLSDA